MSAQEMPNSPAFYFDTEHSPLKTSHTEQAFLFCVQASQAAIRQHLKGFYHGGKYNLHLLSYKLGQFNSWFNYHNPHYSSSSGLPELIHSEGFGLDKILVIALYRSQNGSLE